MQPSIDTPVEERRALFGVRRRAVTDYQAAIFCCPKHPDHRQYQSVRPVVVHDHPDLAYVAAYCYWCDAAGRLRSSALFDRDHPEIHYYPLLEAADADP